MPKAAMKQNNAVITIDGPGATGKSTVAWLVSQCLGIDFLNSGSLYRIAAYIAVSNGISDDMEHLSHLVNASKIAFMPNLSGRDYHIMLDQNDITDEITSDEMGMMASDISKSPILRERLIEKQRQFDRGLGLVADGRDMGSKIFPDATYKFFLTASPQLRAERRFKQLQEKQIDANLEEVYQALLKRDEQDMQRSTAPLVIPKMATVIDTSAVSIKEVVNEIVESCTIQERC